MARVTGPLMSFDASGTIAGAIVFAKWRGRNYVRRHAIPANPRTPAQVAARSIIAFLGQQWAGMSAPDKATWEAGADSEKISAFNQYVKLNARNWRDQQPPSMAYPAARVQTPTAPTLIVPVASGRQALVGVSYSPGGDDWGLAICRALVNTNDPTPGNVVGIVDASAFAGTFVDGPLAPGTYWYNAFSMTEDGVASMFPAWVSVAIS